MTIIARLGSGDRGIMVSRDRVLNFVVKLVAFIVLAVGAVSLSANAQGTGNPRAIDGNVHRIIHIPAEDGNSVPAILMMPVTGIDPYSPAIVLHHGGFGGHPARQVGASRFVAERLSAAGYTTISLLSRQSAGHIDSVFEESQKDIGAAVDFLAAKGIEDIILLGHSLGSVRIAGYLADTQDPRVRAAIHFAPTANMPDVLRGGAGGEMKYLETVRNAQAAIEAGRGRLDLSPDPQKDAQPDADPIVDLDFTFQSPEAYLSWWGPDARTRNSDLFKLVDLPTLLLSGTSDGYVPAGRLRELKDVSPDPSKVDYIWYQDGDHFFSGFQDQSANDVMAWLQERGLGVAPAFTMRLVDAPMETGRYFPATLYAPAEAQPASGPVFLIHDDNQDALFDGANHWLAVKLAQRGYTVLSPMLRSTGFTGGFSARIDEISSDMDDWVSYLSEQGYADVVLIGYGTGSAWTGLYGASDQGATIDGFVFLAPVGDLPDTTRMLLGDEAYEASLRRAETMIADGSPNGAIVEKYYLPAPAPAGTRGLLMAQADSWTELRGAGSPVVLSELVDDIDVPMLSIAGCQDPFVKRAYLRKLKQNAGGQMDLVWYNENGGTDHAFTEYEDRLADDIAAWSERIFQAK